jgi:carbon storage regulator CsrA
MLILARKKHEGVTITVPGAGPIHVMVTDIRGDSVRLGFGADPSIAIHRDEVVVKIQAERESQDTEQ